MQTIKYSVLPNQPRSDGMKYRLEEDYIFYSPYFNRTKTLKAGMLSDGASGARDLGMGPWWLKVIAVVFNKMYQWLPKEKTDAWYLHDGFCQADEFTTGPYWDDGFPVTNFTASTLLSTRLHADRYWLESYAWWFATFLFGGKYIKKVNGWIWIKEAAKWKRKKVDGTLVWVKEVYIAR